MANFTALLIQAKNARSTVAREFIVEGMLYFLWGRKAERELIGVVLPYMSNAVLHVQDKAGFECVANGMRNCYYDGIVDLMMS